jgi:hypothetical protein
MLMEDLLVLMEDVLELMEDHWMPTAEGRTENQVPNQIWMLMADLLVQMEKD